MSKSFDPRFANFKGKPRYLSNFFLSNMSRELQTKSLSSLRVFFEKRILDFSLLTFWPERVQKDDNTSLMAFNFQELLD